MVTIKLNRGIVLWIESMSALRVAIWRPMSFPSRLARAINESSPHGLENVARRSPLLRSACTMLSDNVALMSVRPVMIRRVPIVQSMSSSVTSPLI